MSIVDTGIVPEAHEAYAGQDSFFGGQPPLSLAVGYVVVLGLGVFFSLATYLLVLANQYFGSMGDITSEHFK